MTPCVIPPLAPNPNGYVAIKGKGYVHRLAYESAKGPIPAGMQIDHLCRNRACANPDHLEPVTPEENNRRAAAARTTCKRGHPLDGLSKRKNAPPFRYCKTCDRLRHRKEAS